MKTQYFDATLPSINQPTIDRTKTKRRAGRLLTSVFAILSTATLFGSAPPSFADTMHARSILGLQEEGQCASHYGAADAYLKGTIRRSLWIESHEQLGNNFIHGNAGIGHAHHHSGGCPFNSASDGGGTELNAPPSPVKLGLPGTSLSVNETWLPNSSGDQITVSLTPDTFLQVDLNQLTPSNPLESRISLSADGGLSGSTSLSAWLDSDLVPHVQQQLTGIFEGAPVDLVSHDNGVVSLQFRNPMSWTVPGQVETFDTEVESAISGVNDVGPIAPNAK